MVLGAAGTEIPAGSRLTRQRRIDHVIVIKRAGGRIKPVAGDEPQFRAIGIAVDLKGWKAVLSVLFCPFHRELDCAPVFPAHFNQLAWLQSAQISKDSGAPAGGIDVSQQDCGARLPGNRGTGVPACRSSRSFRGYLQGAVFTQTQMQQRALSSRGRYPQALRK